MLTSSKVKLALVGSLHIQLAFCLCIYLEMESHCIILYLVIMVMQHINEATKTEVKALWAAEWCVIGCEIDCGLIILIAVVPKRDG